MEEQLPTSSSSNFKEVRVSLEPHLPSSVIEFHVPSSAITFALTSRSKRQVQTDQPTFNSEEKFSRYIIANTGSIFFGHRKKHPRSFLWRQLEENKVLEIRSVDLSKGEREEDEALYILRFRFSSAVRPGGIALADGEDQSILNVFALTTSNELYTLELKRAFFCDASASEEEIAQWCKIFKPASTSFSTPHQCVAISSLELFVGLSDGRILHLTRPRGSDGASWHEVACNDGQWGSSLRSIVRWEGSNTVRYGNATLDQDTAQSMAFSPDKKHLWMVCLNHTLKARNMKQGRTVYTTDLLRIAREPHERSKILLDPSNPNMLQVFEIPLYAIEGDQYYLMTFSPHGLGQFKVWAVRDANAGEKGIRDLYPDFTFRAPDPDPDPKSKTIWKVADFKVRLVELRMLSTLHIWILMKSNRRYKLYSLKILSSRFTAALSDVWQKEWTMSTTEAIDHEPQPQVSDAEPKGVIDTWLEFLFRPGRYSPTVIETALSVYAKTRNSNTLLDPKASLKDRMQSLISSNVALQRLNSDAMDFEGYRAELQAQFAELWQEIRDLDALRWDNASLAYDPQRQIPWLVFADGCAPIRECSPIEKSAHSTQDVVLELRSEFETQPGLSSISSVSDSGSISDQVLPKELAVLIDAAANFRQSFSYELLQTCDVRITSELWQEHFQEPYDRIETFYEDCNFGTDIDNDAVDRLKTQLGPIGGLNGLRDEHFRTIVHSLLHTMPETPSKLRSTRFGMKALVRGTQEMVTLSRQILQDLLLLTIVVETECDWDDETDNFHGPTIFLDIVNMLKKFQAMDWLAKNLRHQSSQSPNGSNSNTLAVTAQNRVSTVLENLFAFDVDPQPATDKAETVALTNTIQDVLAWSMGGRSRLKLEDVVVAIQCSLLAHGDIGLASDFLQYQPATSWATYIRGRFYLLKGEFTEAAMHFEKAARDMSLPGPHTDPATSKYLLSPMEAAHFGRGVQSYFTHIQDLFQNAACPSYVATFANKILQRNLPLSQQILPLKTLFSASISISDFDSAFTVLTRLPVETSSELVPAFLAALLAEDEFNRALDAPWPPKLSPHVEGFLAQKACKPSTATFSNPSAPQYSKLLAAWRMRHLDYRGAAAALLVHLQSVYKLKRSSFTRAQDDEIISTYLSVINLLACCGGEDEAWVLTDSFDEVKPRTKGSKQDENKKKRKLVTLNDVRARYQKELDRRSMLENGQFAFGLDGAGEEDRDNAMDVDEGEEDA